MGFETVWGMRGFLALSAALVLGGCSSQGSWGEGVIVPEVPVQDSTVAERWSAGGFTFKPQAEFRIRARVLSKKWYGKDVEGGFAPVDLALGWQAMSDESVLERLDLSQSGRFYRYQWGPEGPPIPAIDIVRSSANMHLAPSSEEIEEDLERVEVGDVVVIEGLLVDVDGPEGRWWRTSTTRNDTGAGACEIIWVERIEIEPAPYR